ncbi:MAG: hypothetical protein IH945_12990 [Armatimonadetes bacterium]|nr:hypothetical protein [Armatimonadota bacterium]
MTLSEYLAAKKRGIYDDLLQGRRPEEGKYDAAALAHLRSRGEPQMGSTVLEPENVRFEFIFPQPDGSAELLTVDLTPPERIVFMPVPAWVVETIWQGDVDGSHHFESDAKRLVEELSESLEPLSNKKLFGRQAPKRRE